MNDHFFAGPVQMLLLLVLVVFLVCGCSSMISQPDPPQLPHAVFDPETGELIQGGVI